jgi:hypothetical protein
MLDPRELEVQKTVTKVRKKMKVGKRQVTVSVDSVTCHKFDIEEQTKDKPDSDASNK